MQDTTIQVLDTLSTIPNIQELSWNDIVQQTWLSLSENEFFQGGFILGLITWVGYQLKSIPIFIWSRLSRYIFFRVYVDDSYELYDPLAKYLSTNHSKSLRNIQADFVWVGDRDDGPYDDIIKLKLSQHSDINLIFVNRWPVLVVKSVETLENAGSKFSRLLNVYRISSLFGKKPILKLLETIRKSYVVERAGSTELKIYTHNTNSYDSEWAPKKIKSYKPFDKLIFKNKKLLIEDLTNYVNNKLIYADLGIANKRGYLFYGPPGNGKSSAIKAMASMLQMNVYIINLPSIGNDGHFISLISSVPTNSIIVFEDIDSGVESRMAKGKEDSTGVSFTTLLNSLSGVHEPEKCIFVMTTNKKDVLDAALIRTGRVDLHVEFPNPTLEEVNEFYNSFYSTKDYILNMKDQIEQSDNLPVSMSDVQDTVIRNPTSIKDASELLIEMIHEK